MASTYIHVGGIEEIPDDAPLALHFLKSFSPALDSNSHADRNSHLAPTATVASNGEPAKLFSDIAPMFDMRAQIASEFYHIVDRAWILPSTEGRTTMLIQWKSTTAFKGREDKPVKVSEFCIMTLGKATGEGKGSKGLWVECMETWMDPSPVANALQELKAGQK